MEPDAPLLLGPGIRQGFGEAGDREIRRRCAIGDRRDDARRKEGERSEQADVPFAHGLPFGNLGEGGNAAEPDVVDPSLALPMAASKASRLSGFIVGFVLGS